MAGDILVARKTASLVWRGRHIVLQQGVTTARAGHPLLDDAGDMFEPLKVDFDVDEDAPVESVAATEAQKETPSAPAGKPDAKAVRAWAAEQGIDVPARGKIPDGVYEQYEAAHS